MSASQSINTQAAARAARERAHQTSRRDLLGEGEFLEALSWEQRRSERSGRWLLLALIHLNGPEWKDAGSRPATLLAQSLPPLVRGTDTAGWYATDQTLGVILTELRDPAAGDAQASIDPRLKEALGAATSAEAAEHARVTYHIYPEGAGDQGDPVFRRENAPGPSRVARILKRSMDIVGSALALTVLSPLLLVLALAVKLTSKGPFLYRQKRVGENGRTFTFLKIRSMFHNNDPGLHRDYVTRMIEGQDVAQSDGLRTGVYKVVNDPRVTAVGRFLRRTSLDELPQFFNVLMGDMSLVGPRPALPYEFELYSAWHRRRVMGIKPGLTGMWQVYGRGRTNFEEGIRLDLRYLDRWSLWLDLKLLFKTPGAVIFGAGAY